MNPVEMKTTKPEAKIPSVPADFHTYSSFPDRRVLEEVDVIKAVCRDLQLRLAIALDSIRELTVFANSTASQKPAKAAKAD